MNCPFLAETRVRYCQSASIRKLIPLTRDTAAQGVANEICNSEEHVSCATFRRQPDIAEPAGPCPLLRESLMQYCSAAPVTRLIPYSESLNSRCGNGTYRYCELYLTMAHPDLTREEVDGIPMPGWLRYSSNHMWLDVTGDGICHAGIDAFLCRVLGSIDEILFIRRGGRQRPGVVLRSAGLDLEMVFPNELVVASVNLYLRANPARLVNEPYTGGWLFEGVPDERTSDNLLEGVEARIWMQEENRRMNEYLQQCSGASADGGLFAEGVAARLDRAQAMPLFHNFFSPYAGAAERKD
jgi:glycine cleavage system H lipoate-binding protein